MRRTGFLATLALPLMAIILSGCNDSPEISAQKSPRAVFVQPLGFSDGIEHKLFNGVIQSKESAQVSFRVPGTVANVPVIAGQSVQQGEELARLDPHDYEVIVVELEAKRAEAKAAHAFAQSEYNRVKQASQSNAVAALNLERAESSLLRAEAGLRIVEQNLQKANDAVSYTVLTAPFDGIVGEINIESFEQILPAVPVIELHQPNRLEVVIDVPENQLPRFKTGQEASVKWFGSEAVHPASVSEISTVAHPIKQTFDVIFSLDEEVSGLLPGKSVTMHVPLVAEQDETYCVPFSAVLQEKDAVSVFTVSEDSRKVSQKSVTIARVGENELCVLGELTPEQLIITAGVHYLTNGQEVGQFLKNE